MSSELLTSYHTAFMIDDGNWGDKEDYETTETLPIANYSNFYERKIDGDDYVYKLLKPKPVAQPIIIDAPVIVSKPPITNPWGTTKKPVATLSEIMAQEQVGLSSKSETIEVEDSPVATIGPITVKNAWGTTNKPVVTLSKVMVEQMEEPVTDEIIINTTEQVSVIVSTMDYNHASVKKYLAADLECSLVWKEFTVLNGERTSNPDSIALLEKIIKSLEKWLVSYAQWVTAKNNVFQTFNDFDFEKCFADTHNEQEVLEQQGGHCINMNSVFNQLKTWRIKKYRTLLNKKLKSKK